MAAKNAGKQSTLPLVRALQQAVAAWRLSAYGDAQAGEGGYKDLSAPQASRQAGDFTKDFLLIAPNLIVLDRLFGDSKNPEFFEGAIFKKFPFIRPEWSSDFQLDVIGPDEERESTKPSTLCLLNWQKFVERENGEAENPVQDILGPKPPSEIAVSLAKLKDRLAHLSNVMVLNDEAHHVWDEELVK